MYSAVDQELRHFGVRHCRLTVFTREPCRDHDIAPLWQDVVARVERPYCNVMSLLQYLHALTKEAVRMWPSIHSAMYGIMSHADSDSGAWSLHCALHHKDPSEAVDSDAVIVLQCKTALSNSKVGPHLANSEDTISTLSFELHMRPRPGFVEKGIDRHANDQTINLLVKDLMIGLQKELLYRAFSSNASLVEAAALYIERSFSSSVFDRYCQLECIRTLGRGGPRGASTYWRHERFCQNAINLPKSVGRSVLLYGEHNPRTWSAQTENQDHALSVFALAKMRAVAN